MISYNLRYIAKLTQYRCNRSLILLQHISSVILAIHTAAPNDYVSAQWHQIQRRNDFATQKPLFYSDISKNKQMYYILYYCNNTTFILQYISSLSHASRYVLVKTPFNLHHFEEGRLVEAIRLQL
ncbi:Hypothetical_protein [Hexamita inflata]|uniref:Hypothetical_protein n=1 Tax=Hexamita inflata TaxID=28002 RepID=A0AA86RDP9_9EUKA|nr:Hypothetical protein HINF_LOCUS58194 [Hexamita inflata]